MADKSGAASRELALATLREVCADRDAPAAARAQAARTLLEIEGSLGKHAKAPERQDKPLSDMSREDMAAEIAALRARRAAELT